MQNYKNHVRYYPPHHFVFLPVCFAGVVFCACYYFKYPDLHSVWLALAGIFLLVFCLAVMLRQHYALTIQNRLVCMEMRFRYFTLTQQRFEPIEEKLTFGQIAALRFAPDEELPALVTRTLAENLSADAIKKSIINWKPDNMRV
jgi:hypothetical protein